MKKMMILSMAIAAATLVAGCGVWRPAYTVTPPMVPSYCTPIYSDGCYKAVPRAPVKASPAKFK